MKWVAAAAAAGAALLLVGAAAAKTWRLHGLGVTVVLPARWAQEQSPGWRFKAADPVNGTAIFINAFPASLDRGTFRTDVLRQEKQAVRKEDKHGVVTARGAHIGSVSAIEVEARYAGLTAYLYGFTHGGQDYTLELVAMDGDLAQVQPQFAAALQSLRFLG